MLLWLAAAPGVAHAAACCVSATSFGVGRLLIWEDFALGVQAGHARILGTWDRKARFDSNPAGYSEGVSHVQAWVIARLHRRAELQGWVPALLNDRSSDGTRQLAGGLGDVGAALRLQVLAIGAIQHLPSLALTATGVAPTGRRVEETSPPLFAGATGLGAWAAGLAFESEYAPSPWFVRLEGGVMVFRSFVRPDTGQSQHYGPLLRGCLSGGREVVPGRIVVAAALSAERQSRLELGGVTVPDSEALLIAAATSVAWRFDPHWTLLAVVANSVWPDGMGMNRDGRIDLTLGARYGHF